jgi:LPXTG-motif cell wall-anchored protein
MVRQRPRGLIWAVPSTLIFVLAIAAGVTAQPNTGGKITAGVFFGVFLLVILGAWLSVNRRRARLEIDSGSISYWISKRGSPSFTLRRTPDSELRLIPAQRARGATADARLTLAGADADGTDSGGAGEIILFGFSVPAVRRSCEAAGWRFT